MKIFIGSLVFILIYNFGFSQINVTYTINTNLDRKAISPFIYGMNNGTYNDASFRRLGGNRMTGYNWENNASNAGNDYLHQSDDYLCWNMGITAPDNEKPAKVITTFHDTSLLHNAQSAITIPMAGYVARDKNGPVDILEVAPSIRWSKISLQKGSAFSLTPDTSDSKIYIDEFLNFLITKYGNSSSSTGIKNYILDNEPGLWKSTHPRIHPDTNNCKLYTKTAIKTAKLIKSMDANAKIFGPESYGFYEYLTFQEGEDWPNLSNTYPYFVSMFLDSMSKASATANQRLLDVLSVHWYPNSNLGWIGSQDTSLQFVAERVQFPRTLWDSTYVENSWIEQYYTNALPILPMLKKQINTYYPGTKLGLTEYDYGGDSHISGGLAQAEALMGFIKTGTEYASKWNAFYDYSLSAIELFHSINKPFLNTSVLANTSNKNSSNIVSSIYNSSDSELHIIVTNKDMYSSVNGTFNLTSNTIYDSISVYSVFRNNTAIQYTQLPNSTITSAGFNYTLAPASMHHFVLKRKAYPASLNDMNLVANDVEIFPNPANDILNISNKSTQKFNIEIINSLGQIMMTNSISDNISTINISSFPKGIYSIRFTTNEGNFNKQFVK